MVVQFAQREWREHQGLEEARRSKLCVDYDSDAFELFSELEMTGKTTAESRGDAWKTLQDWISGNFTCDRDFLRHSVVVFGTGSTYFAKTPNGCLWNNIPSDLEATISEHMADRGPPSDVCLGVHQTWVAFWSNGSSQWNLKTYYGQVHERLSRDISSEWPRITRLVLDPYSSDYFMHTEDGRLSWSVQFDESARKSFVQRCRAYMQERAREDETTFKINHQVIGEKTAKSGYVISPLTKWDVEIENSVARKVIEYLPLSDAWSEKARQTAAWTGWSLWSGAAVAGGVFATTYAFVRRGAGRLFRR
jgi:hypothetical protein